MTSQNINRTKTACFCAYFTMSSIFSLPPLLFVTFHDLYGVSFTLLGTLVLVNFFTQLAVDLILTLFSKHFNVHTIVKVMPLITTAGLLLYALSPVLFPQNVYIGLLLGTVIFSLSAGLSEVLLSPMIAAIPSEHPQKDMSFLHSLYASGVFTVVILTTLFFSFFEKEHWMYLTVFFALLPIIAAVLFMRSPMPDMSASSNESVGARSARRGVGLALCVGCIFFGSCAENVMSNWISGYIESTFAIDKAMGDILGMALFALLLWFARVSFSKYGKHIMAVLLAGMSGAAVCYLIAGLTSHTAVALAACAMTGLFTAMLWPGSLIMMEENLPAAGVTAYALMASGGDLGASVAPQLMGIVVDRVSASGFATDLALRTGLSTEQIGMKTGMLVSSLFPIIGTVLLLFVIRYFKRRRMTDTNSK